MYTGTVLGDSAVVLARVTCSNTCMYVSMTSIVNINHGYVM